MNRSPLEWDAFVEGQQFGPYDYHVDQQVVASLRASVGDVALVLIDGEAVAPATILTVPFLQLLEWAYVPPAWCHPLFPRVRPARTGTGWLDADVHRHADRQVRPVARGATSRSPRRPSMSGA